jgi:hypothetical protein
MAAVVPITTAPIEMPIIAASGKPPEVDKQDVLPKTFATAPEGQCVQVLAPAVSEKKFGGQGTQVAIDEAPLTLEDVPA